MKDSKIEWTDHTANLWWGCTKVHAGCDNCYAEAQANRYNHQIWGNDNPRKATKSVWANLLSWQAQAAAEGTTKRVFVGSMMDIFERPMPLVSWQGNNMPDTTDDLRQDFFHNYVPACPNLHFLLLTKRPSNINKLIPEAWKAAPPPNVMFGTSPVSQETAYTLVNQLIKVNGKRFLSVEPQLSSISLLHWLPQIDWVIQGGESGHHKRPFNLDWAYDMKEQCKAVNVPYFFKQIDKVQPIPDWAMVRQFPNHSPFTVHNSPLK
jgi:protein gp37